MKSNFLLILKIVGEKRIIYKYNRNLLLWRYEGLQV